MRALQLTDPAEDWVWDENDACWRSRDPEQRLRVEKGLKSLVLIDPTQYQPGQAQAVPGEKRTGVWKITKFSGAVSRDRKAQLVENAEALLAALRQAHERANHASAERQDIAGLVSAFLPGWAGRSRAPLRPRHPSRIGGKRLARVPRTLDMTEPGGHAARLLVFLPGQ